MNVSEAPAPWWAPDVVQMCPYVQQHLALELTINTAIASWSQDHLFTSHSEGNVV